MAKIFKTLRNHWKKSTFAAVACYFGIDYLLERHKNFLMMRNYCKEAGVHGHMPLPLGAKNKHITLILNPMASNRKGKNKLEKYAEPILHMAGYLVSIVQTERISEAQELASAIDKTNIICVAGGDGTLLEVITGLFRRDDAEEAISRFPIAYIPVGTHNNFVKRLFTDYNFKEPKIIAESAMAVVKHRIEAQDVMKVSILNNEQEKDAEDTTTINSPKESDEKSFYPMTSLKLGHFREVDMAKDKMPGFFGNNFSTFWSLLRTSAPETFKAEIKYIESCGGCKKCEKEEPNKSRKSYLSRIFSLFTPVLAQEIPIKSSKSDNSDSNPNCGVWNSICVDTSEFNICVKGDGKLEMQIGPKSYGKIDLISEGFNRLKGVSPSFSNLIEISEAEIIPITSPEFMSMDNEEFEVKPLKISLMKNKIYFFKPVIS